MAEVKLKTHDEEGTMAGYEHVVLHVPDMMCMKNCGNTVSQALRSENGVEHVFVDFAPRHVHVYGHDLNVSSLVEGLDTVGFDATELANVAAPKARFMKRYELKVEGMMCMKNCGNTVQNALRDVNGVLYAAVDFPNAKAVVVCQPSVTADSLIEAADDVGFDCSKLSESEVPVMSKTVPDTEMEGASEKAVDRLRALPWVVSAPHTNHELRVQYSPQDVKGDLEQAIHDALVSDATAKTTASRAASAASPKPEAADTEETFTVEVAPLGEGTEFSDINGEVVLTVGNMSCSSCVAKVEKALKALPGVFRAAVSLATNEATVGVTVDGASAQAIAEHVTALGYDAHVVSDSRRGGDDKGDQLELVVSISGMSCAACVGKVEKAVKALPGVAQVSVSLATSQATIEFSRRAQSANVVMGAIERLGYECSQVSLAALGSAGGGAKAALDAMQRSQAIELRKWRKKLIWSLVLGIPTVAIQMLPTYSDAFDFLNVTIHNKFTLRLLLLIILSTPVQFGVGASFYRVAWMGIRNSSLGMDFLIVMGTTAAYLYSIMDSIVALASPMHESMPYYDTSVMLFGFLVLGKFLESKARGRTSSALVELLQLAPSQANLVTNAATIPALQWREDGGEEKQGDYDSVAGVKEELVDASLISVGDIVKVYPGDRIPVDGTVVAGAGDVDESMITGEWRHVPKSRGASVVGGSVNQEGCIYVRAGAVGEDSTLSRIVTLVQKAQASKAPIQDFADRVSAVFAPVVVGIAVVVFCIWLGLSSSGVIAEEDLPHNQTPFLFSLLFGISVVVTACPCALGLATPTAMMVGTGVGAKRGVLIKSGRALETASRINHVLFDKTGTLTLGKPSVTDVVVVGLGNTAQDVLAIAGAVEHDSEHVLGKAIMSAGAAYIEHLSDADWTAWKLTHEGATQDDMGVSTTALKRYSAPLDRPTPSSVVKAALRTLGNLEDGDDTLFSDFAVRPGRGVEAKAVGGAYRVGSLSWMAQCGVTVHSTAWQAVGELQSQGKTVVAVADQSSILGIIAMSDKPRDDAKAAVKFLRQHGVRVTMLTGDNATTARNIAASLGIVSVAAEVLPGGKAEVVSQFQKQGDIVAMVGDGINDAPALAQADVGLGMGAGTQVAIESADIVLIKSNPWDVVTALDLSRKVFRRIRLNLMWALLYNCVGIPLAGGILFVLFGVGAAPEIAALAMALSSVSVVMSSLHLKTYKVPTPERTKRRKWVKKGAPSASPKGALLASSSGSDSELNSKLIAGGRSDHELV